MHQRSCRAVLASTAVLAAAWSTSMPLQLGLDRTFDGCSVAFGSAGLGDTADVVPDSFSFAFKRKYLTVKSHDPCAFDP